jgi:Icc protein
VLGFPDPSWKDRDMAATVLQLSDTHLRETPNDPVSGFDPDRRLAVVLDAWAVREEPLDLVLLTGDDADDASASGLARLHAAVDALGAPVFAIPGNHDDPARVADEFGGAAATSVDGWRIVGLDSSVPGQIAGAIDVPAAMAVVDEDGGPAIVAIHHPPRSRSTHPWFQLDGAEELLEELGSRSHVRALVSGHLHDAFELSGPGGLPLLGCPSTLMAIAHDGDQMQIGADAPTGARILRLADDGTLSSEVLEA